MPVWEPEPGKAYSHVYIVEGDVVKDITSDADSYVGKKGPFKALEIEYFGKSKRFAGYSYVDLLYKGVTGKFIDVTMSGYEKSVGDEFGKTIPGIFTDEPNISPPAGRTVRWTPDLFNVFRKTWNYDLEPHLLSLFEQSGDWHKIRHDYYAVLLNMFIDRWSVPWHEYTKKNHLKWTGHYWEHGWPVPVHGGDNMAMYPYHQIPGIDMLFNNTTDRPDQFGNVRAVKELASVANQFGRSRALSETYGGSGYELDFISMKRNGDWEYALGVNMMNQHLSFQSMLGDRKHDFPQTFSYQTPWWNDYRIQADYFGRLSLALSSGKQINNSVVIEPTTTGWMVYQPSSPNEDLNKLDNDFRTFIDDLERFKIEYDLASEKTIRDFGKTEKASLKVGSRSYNLIVLPKGMLNIESHTADMLEKYLASGGKVLAFCLPPSYVDGSISELMSNMKQRYSKNWFEARDISDPAIGELLGNGKIRFGDAARTAENVYYMRRNLDDGQIIFFANFQRGSSKDFTITLPGMKDIIEMDATDGKFYNIPFSAGPDAGIIFPVHLDDAGSILLYASDSKISVERSDRKEWTAKSEIKITGSEVRRQNPNVIALDYCYLDFPDVLDDGDTLLYFYTAHDRIFQHYGFEDNPWVSSSQFRTEILDRDTFGINTGFKVTFPVNIDENTNVTGLDLVVERPELYTVRVNGHPLNRREGEWYLDKGTGVFPTDGFLHEGLNLIDIIASPFNVRMELAPVFLTGDFSVVPAKHGWLVTEEIPVTFGSWKSMGMPFYPGEVVYTRNISAVTGMKAKVVLTNWNGTCAKISVNGNQAGILGWPPYEKDISAYLKEGENRISVTVTGSLKNLIGPFHFVKTKGLVTPWSFKYAPEVQPGGDEYDMVDYGLFSGFKIMTP